MLKAKMCGKKLRANQEGLASIIIVTVIISLVTIITLGFATIIRREQRQTLDQQISTQARYAAESAINKKIAEYRANPASVNTTTNCTDVGTTFSSGSDEIQTTCVQVDLAPGPLEYDQIKTSESTLVWLDPDRPIDHLVITWQNVDSVTDNDCLTTDYNHLPTSVGSTQIGMLRFDLSRVGENGDTFTRSSLSARNFGGILHPKASGVDSRPYEPGAVFQPVVFGTCGVAPPGVDSPLAAHAIINMPNDPSIRNSKFIMRLRGVYRNSKAKVIGYDIGGQVIDFADSQIAIEATARVNDVVQRVQVRIPAGSPPRSIIPDDAIHVTNAGLCKLVETEPLSTVDNCNDPTYTPGAPSLPLPPPEEEEEPEEEPEVSDNTAQISCWGTFPGWGTGLTIRYNVFPVTAPTIWRSTNLINGGVPEQLPGWSPLPLMNAGIGFAVTDLDPRIAYSTTASDLVYTIRRGPNPDSQVMATQTCHWGS